MTTSVPNPQIPAFGISRTGLCASSAANGSSSIPKKNHIANGIAATIAQNPLGRNVELPSVGAISNKLSTENLPLTIAMIANMARTAREAIATTIANLNDTSAPAMFNNKKIA